MPRALVLTLIALMVFDTAGSAQQRTVEKRVSRNRDFIELQTAKATSDPSLTSARPIDRRRGLFASRGRRPFP